MTSNRIAGTIACQRCGKEFHPINGRAKTQKYCSLACRDVPRTLINTLTTERAAWMAALLDGEGNIGHEVWLGPRSRGVRITITNTYRPLIDAIREVTGVGWIGTHEHANPNHRTRYNWILTGANAKSLLRQCLPWLIVKRDKALAALGDDSGPG